MTNDTLFKFHVKKNIQGISFSNHNNSYLKQMFYLITKIYDEGHNNDDK